MIFRKHFSSSRGNLYEVIAGNGRRLLIECGVTWKRVEKALDYNLAHIEACLVSHEHKDHAKAVEDVLAAGIPIYASRGTLDGIDESLALSRNVYIIEDRQRFTINETFDVFPFVLHHDAAEPLGFIIHAAEGENLLFATDTSHITQRFGLAFQIIALECSYDKQILRKRVDTMDINETVAKRLLESHQERRVAKRYLAEFCDLSQCREVHLIHASGDNLDKKAVRKEIEQSLFVKTYI